MHFKMLSAICFNLDQSKILSSGNGFSAIFTQHGSCSIAFFQIAENSTLGTEVGKIIVQDPDNIKQDVQTFTIAVMDENVPFQIESDRLVVRILYLYIPAGCLSGEHVGLMTWRL